MTGSCSTGLAHHVKLSNSKAAPHTAEMWGVFCLLPAYLVWTSADLQEWSNDDEPPDTLPGWL